MKDEDLLRCPLLQSLDALHRAELLWMLNDSNLRENLEKCLAEHARAAAKPTRLPTSDLDRPQMRNFEREVHSWDPDLPMWRRSAKE